MPTAALAETRPAPDAPQRKLPVDWSPTSYDLRDTWFPVAHARDVGAEPVRRVVHAQTYWLWRNGDRPMAAEFAPHELARRRHSASAFTGGLGYYPVVERFGYLWAWYGNPDRADAHLIPEIPFLPRDGDLPPNTRRTVRFDCSSALSVENLLDLTHADFLHPQLVGDHRSESDTVEVEWTSETLTRTRVVIGRPVAPLMRWVGGVRAQFQDLRLTLHVHLRNSVCISYPRFRPGFDIPNVQPFVPVGSHRSRLDVVQDTRTAPLAFRHLMPRTSYVIRNQDNSVVRPQHPRYIGQETQRDLHSRFDKPGARYRFMMEQLAARQRGGDFSYGSDVDPGRDISGLLGMDL
jgi:hypothetical protein